jgi:hypothetical protein
MIFLSILGIVVYVIDEIPKMTNSIRQSVIEINQRWFNLLYYYLECLVTIIWCKFFFSSCFNSFSHAHHLSWFILCLVGGVTSVTLPAHQPNHEISKKPLFLFFTLLLFYNFYLTNCTICSMILFQNSLDVLFRGGSVLIAQILIKDLTKNLKKRSLLKLQEVMIRLQRSTEQDQKMKLEQYESEEPSPSCQALINEYSDRIHQKTFRYTRILVLCWHISVYVKCWITFKEESIALMVYLMKLLTLVLIEILQFHMMRKEEEAKLRMIHPLEWNEFEYLFENVSPVSPVNTDEAETAATLDCCCEACPICLSSQSVETIKLSTCGHMFHEGCILAMMRHQEDESRSRRCPICRTAFSH